MNVKEAEQKLRDVVRRKHFSLSTEDSYAHWLHRFCLYVKKLPAGLSSEKKMEAFLSAMAKDDVSASTQNQAFNALLLFYQECLGQKLQGIDSLRAKRGAFVRRAPSMDEVRSLLAEIKDEGSYPVRLTVKLLYGCGLRVTEPLSLRLRDIQMADSRLIIRQAKGRKDRVVAIPCSLFPEIKAQIQFAESIWQRDVAAHVPIKLPGLLAKKYPNAQFSKSWAWVFPQLAPCRDPRGGALVRWHQLESSVQRAVKNACRRLNLDIKPHELRHAYATHCLNGGQNPRAIQEAMGHKSLETTMGYMHAEALSVRSPLETLLW
ncbi:MAG: tyrosine-type recombinase/integrase [Patescibacteria group bacterium]|nr:tyrosine-type recombinase/integrase [Patescibacteria group bacterium]